MNEPDDALDAAWQRFQRMMKHLESGAPLSETDRQWVADYEASIAVDTLLRSMPGVVKP